MIWLTWRQLRTQAAAVYALVAAVAVVVARDRSPAARPGTNGAGNVFDQPHPDRPQACSTPGSSSSPLRRRSSAPSGARRWWPASWRSGTHRLVWNQSVTRTRWLATKLGLTALAAAAAVGLLTLAVTWWSDADGRDRQPHPGQPARPG